jgi:mRNA interferase MazF
MVLLLSWDTAYRFRDRLAVAPVTTRIRGLDAEVFLDHNDGLDRGCVVNLDVIATIPRSVLDRRVAQLSEAKMGEVERAIHLALGMRLPCEVR